MDTENPNLIIDRLGGTSATALLCEVKPPSVSEWRHHGIPKAQLKFLKAIRPDVFLEQPVPPPTRRATDALPPEAPDGPRRQLPDGKNVTSLNDPPATFEKQRP